MDSLLSGFPKAIWGVDDYLERRKEVINMSKKKKAKKR